MQVLDEVCSEKKALRKIYKGERIKLSEIQRKSMDKDIYFNLVNFEPYLKSDKIFMYISKGLEVDTWRVLKHSLENKKKVLAPRCKSFKPEMDFYKINSANDLRIGLYGIYEPAVPIGRIENDFSHSLCVVPGLCFDKRGFRVGYGKGYYDRFLKNFSGVRVGLCYSEFMEEEILHDEFDEAVDFIVTEKGIVAAKQNS